MTTVTLQQALAKGYGNWRSFTCPEHADTNPSARVNVTTGRWVCMVCHATGDTKGYVPDPNMELEQIMAMLDTIDLDKSETWLDQFDIGDVHEYWLGRFGVDVCRRYRLGWDGVASSPCYPIRGRRGTPLGVVHRNLGGTGPKYHYPRGVRTTELIFGVKELRQSKRIFLVEGAMDVVAVSEAGYDAVATYGARLFDPQIREIMALEPNEVVIAYDMDDAGHLGAKEARSALRAEGIMTRRALWHQKYRDLGDMPVQLRRTTLSKILASTSTDV